MRRPAPRLALVALVAAAVAARAALLTDPDDARIWQRASVLVFASLFGISRQEVIDRHLLDDGAFDVSHAHTAVMVRAPPNNALCGYYPAPNPPFFPGPYDYEYGTDCNTSPAGDRIDNHWTHLIGEHGDQPGEYVWRLRAPSSKAAIFPAIDHGPLPQEALEATVFLGNSPTGLWTPAEIQRIWLEGFDANVLWEGFTYPVGLRGDPGGTFSYVKMVAGGAPPNALLSDGDAEINGVIGLDERFEPPVVVDLSCRCQNAEARSAGR